MSHAQLAAVLGGQGGLMVVFIIVIVMAAGPVLAASDSRALRVIATVSLVIAGLLLIAAFILFSFAIYHNSFPK